ncbi:SGNH/GDSL hydrolase family protein [Rhodothermus profundi]|uniref:GDSL-like Lipase/Acylhydrolase n=1 Tax=Rhodothermus profundi TaxID=633813 RepID=A0A1M6TZ97_9BACT|nr:SGNH/GDSL hydrolase family protein [Rhodothermus profundi]SHK62276.1 GDSL-like Lipase/Acylhydrolase [Rhodothermus profundi]
MNYPLGIAPFQALPKGLLALLLLTLGCRDEALQPPEPIGGELFARYVAIGNSITAGYQSGGINATLQQQAYPVLLAAAMGTPFNVPLLRDPGCPPPLINLLTGERLGDLPGNFCAYRQLPAPRIINNVAVPGAKVIDVLTNLGEGTSANTLTLLLLGGRTQLEAAAEARPTFVSVWIGNNDVLGAAIAGDPALVTPIDAFRQRYRQMLNQLQAMGVQGGLLIGVANVAVIPHLSPGIAYAQAKQGGAFPPTFNVADNCATTEATALVPFSYAFGELLATALQGQSVTLDCADDPRLLSPEETATIIQTVQEYNAFIQQEAERLGWAYLDPNPILLQLKENGEIPHFPRLTSSEPFGPYFSLDGVHPSSLAHQLIAQEAAAAINAVYGTNLQIPVQSPPAQQLAVVQ